MAEFEREVEGRLNEAAGNSDLRSSASAFMERSIAAKYSYNWFWMGRPIIQYPQDICAMQELVWRVRPDVIVETGIAHGGSLVLSASLLAMLDLCDATEAGVVLDPTRPSLPCSARAETRSASSAPWLRIAVPGPAASSTPLVSARWASGAL